MNKSSLLEPAWAFEQVFTASQTRVYGAYTGPALLTKKRRVGLTPPISHAKSAFITNCMLSIGKSLNIKPPGERTQQHFDDFRSEINARYGLADPTDPHRARNVAIPNHGGLKIAAEALRSDQRSPDNVRGLVGCGINPTGRRRAYRLL